MSESASGEADVSTESDGKEFSCPSCSRSFGSEMGLNQHHSRTHGESLKKHTKPCDNCGDEITVHDFELKRQDHHFCGRSCSSEFQKDRTEKLCEICGEQFEIIPFEKDTAKYCSSECRIEATRRITGEERYNYKTQEYDCSECGSTVERSPSMVYSKDRVFCSNRCFDEHRRNGYEQYYGRNWNRQRRKALRRDQYRCVDCGLTAKDLYREPDVHHRKPIGKFKEKFSEPEWWERGNRIENLVTLCPSCHRKWERWPVQPQVA